MKVSKFIIFFGLIVSSHCNLHADRTYFGVDFGAGDVTVNGGFFPDLTMNDDTDGVLLAELTLGYDFSTPFLVELALANYGSFSGTDLDDIRLAAGYVFPSNSKTNFYTKAGVSFWNLESKRTFDGSFVNSDRIGKRSGEDLFFQFGLSYAFTQRFSCNLSYDISRPDYGQSSSGRLGLRWSF